MRGSHTLLFIGLGSAVLLAFAWKKNGGTTAPDGKKQTPGNSATAGTTPSKPTPSSTTVADPTKVLVEEAKKQATEYGRQAIINWFSGKGQP